MRLGLKPRGENQTNLYLLSRSLETRHSVAVLHKLLTDNKCVRPRYFAELPHPFKTTITYEILIKPLNEIAEDLLKEFNNRPFYSRWLYTLVAKLELRAKTEDL